MKKLRLGEILLSEGKIDAAQLKAALAYQRRWGKKLGSCLVDLNFLSEIDVVQSLARSLRLPLIDLTKIESNKITKDILSMVSLPTARKHRIVPLAEKMIHRKKRLVVASSDPTNYNVFDEVQFKAGLPLLVMLAPDSDIDWFIRKYYLSEGEALPESYVSGISLIHEIDESSVFDDPDQIKTEAIESIFADDEFTSQSKVSNTHDLMARSKKKD